MSFDIRKYVKLPAFLVFVGIALALIAFYLADAHGAVAHAAKFVGVIGLFLALAGFSYEKLYPAIILALLLALAGSSTKAQSIPALPELDALPLSTMHVAEAMAAGQSVSPSVLLAWLASTSSVPTNPGNYGVYRAVSTAGVCGTFAQIAVLPGLTFTDVKVAGGASYCYYVTFMYTPSGTANSVETAVADLDPTDQITVGPILGTAPPPPVKAASPTNLIGKIQ